MMTEPYNASEEIAAILKSYDGEPFDPDAEPGTDDPIALAKLHKIIDDAIMLSLKFGLRER